MQKVYRKCRTNWLSKIS